MKKHKEIRFPKTRMATFDVVELGRKKHHMKGLLEIDVTRPLDLIREFRVKNDQQLSFTAWLLKTIGTTLIDFQQAYAYLYSKKKAVVFEDIDIAITVEREYHGMYVPLPYVIRQVDQKSMVAITEEINTVKNRPITSKDVVLGQDRISLAAHIYYSLPGFMRRMIWKHYLLKPGPANKNMGNVAFTSIGMMGNASGWFIHTSVHPIAFGVSSIKKKPGVIGQNIEIRSFLHMTVLLDHDVIDGAPMARFITKLSKNIESGLGLTD